MIDTPSGLAYGESQCRKIPCIFPRFIPVSAIPSRQDAPLVESWLLLQLDGNGIGREPKCLDDIPGNPDGDIGYTWFHLMKKR